MSAQGLFIEDLEVGQADEFTKIVTEKEIELFAEVSGDDNPVHLDADYAAGTMFKERIAHGMLSAGFISAVIGTRLPGPGAIYMSQQMRFRAPVKIGDSVTARCTIKEIDSKRRRVTLETVCLVGETVVIDGEALVMVPSKTAQ
jgi:3-hydroxybutyryl-CoA dehydratase